MLLMLASYSLYGPFPTYSLPLSPIHPHALELLATSDSPCRILGECRTMSDIVWSCLATIFACTWVAIHPNLPGPADSWLLRSRRRVGITLMALIAPEVVIMWAMRQWLAARIYRNSYRERGWTITHGFFAIMGGFMLCDECGPKQVLMPRNLQEFADNGTINFPDITKGEIEDRSKGDLLSKGLVVLQTTWFVAQCCARGIEGLPLTELEIVTLAYAVVNFLTYSIWWHKPLNVQYAYRIQKKPVPDSGSREMAAKADAIVIAGSSRTESIQQGEYGLVSGGAASADGSSQNPGFAQAGHSLSCRISFGFFVDIITLAIEPFIDMAIGSSDGPPHPLRVATFSDGFAGANLTRAASLATATVAMGFGAIHCIAWSFDFPSPHERLLWHISSIAITSIPLFLLSSLLFRRLDRVLDSMLDDSVMQSLIRAILSIFLGSWLALLAFAGFLYVIVRLDILVQAVIALRAPPEGVFKTIQWTTLIPHL